MRFMLLYIDPGTGSMLFTILIGVFGAAFFSLRLLFMKLRFFLSGGRQKDQSSEKKQIVIFSDDKRYWNVFEPVCRELNERKLRISYLTASPDDPGIDNPYEYVDGEFIGEGNRAFARMNFLNAYLVLSTTPGLDVYQWRRSKKVDHYSHIVHAASDVTLYHMFGVDYYDSLLLSGDYQEEQIRKLESKRGLPQKELVQIGLPYMDSMLQRLNESRENDAGTGAYTDTCTDAGTNTGTETVTDTSISTGSVTETGARSGTNGRITVLLASSWGKNGILNVYGGRIIEALREAGFHVVIRPHPQSYISERRMLEKLMEKYPESEDLEWNRDNDNFEVLKRSDIMISDFSGVIFDFALVYDKPVIYTDTEFDKGVYDAWWLDDSPWVFEILPELGAILDEEGLENIGSLVRKYISDSSFSEGRKKARREAWAAIGCGARNAADFLEKKLFELQEKAV